MDSTVASQKLVAACVAPESMSAALQEIANASGVEGVTLTYSRGPRQLGALTSEGLLEHVPPYLSANRPRDPRPLRVNPILGEGFRLDQDDFTMEELARDPFYQEFLKPRGLGWHACALLANTQDGGSITLSLRRAIRHGAFEQSDLESLTAQLPLIRATAGVTQLMNGAFESKPKDARKPYLFGFEPDGTAFMLETDSDAPDVLSVSRGRLVTADDAQAPRVRNAIRRAQATHAPASTVLTGSAGRLYLFTMVPAAKMVPDGLAQLMSWASLVPLTAHQAPSPDRVRAVMADLGLSAAEARVALLIGEARTIEDTAQVLGTGVGTVRNHLKSVFAKIGVRRQAELVAMLSRV